MDVRRIVASSRPCNGRRLVARKWPRVGADGFVNTVKKLQRREICSKRNCAFSLRSSDAHERFRNIRLQEEYDTLDLDENYSFVRRRSQITEIFSTRDLVFALTQSGVCGVFNRETNQQICFLNITRDQAIRSLFYNKNDDSLITVSICVLDHFSSLKCKSTKIESIRQGLPYSGKVVFGSEYLRRPSTVEFDDINGKVLTYSALDSLYKVFDLRNYARLYTISDRNIQVIKFGPGIMLLMYHKASSHITLKILSIEDGTVLRCFNHALHLNKDLEFIELFNEKIIIKQEDENLEILDVQNFDLIEVSKMKFVTPSAFSFLYGNRLFLTFINRTVAAWNLRGELVTLFEDHFLQQPETNSLYITSDQDLIISHCIAKSDHHSTEINDPGSINISNILTGKCVAKLTENNAVPSEEYSWRKNSVSEALENITAVFYNEERNEIYTGNRYGLIHVWSN